MSIIEFTVQFTVDGKAWSVTALTRIRGWNENHWLNDNRSWGMPRGRSKVEGERFLEQECSRIRSREHRKIEACNLKIQVRVEVFHRDFVCEILCDAKFY